MDWKKTKYHLPKPGSTVWTKIDDEKGERNVQKLRFENNLWWSGNTYVYYDPTHWATLEVEY